MDENVSIERHEEMVRALFEEKSLEAFIFLIEAGRELELKHCGEIYFISKDGSRKYVSIWSGEKERSFDSVQTLIEQMSVNMKPFISVWKEVEILTLF